MSAFVVSKQDIDILVTAYCAARAQRGLNPTALGRMLWRENVKSVAYRYSHLESYDGCFCEAKNYAFEPIIAKAAAVAKITRCFGYQACEHPTWETSRAHRIVKALMAAFPDTLLGYEAMPWGISGEADLALARV